eukprot:7076072-Prymnesium_polylepis.1
MRWRAGRVATPARRVACGVCACSEQRIPMAHRGAAVAARARRSSRPRLIAWSLDCLIARSCASQQSATIDSTQAVRPAPLARS